MHKVTFHNLGNADCVRIDLENGKKLLFDYADTREPDNDIDLRCDLPSVLREDLGDRDYFDVVAFTHLDRDHYAKATDFFYFEHLSEYQGDVEEKPRIKMKIMWVPSDVITESLGRDARSEAKAIQREARERFKAKSGIRVFSRPARLKKWCKENGIDLEDRRDLITDAGNAVPEFTTAQDGVELFVHSPFAMRQDEETVEDRNNDALVMHATFTVAGVETKLILASDVDHEILTDIVNVTESKGRNTKLEWHIFKLPHHCSHCALTSEERKGDKSVPEPQVARLFEHYGQEGCIVVSTSDPIPEKGSAADVKRGANPPHRQAANYYKEDVVDDADDFKVTMEHPDSGSPSPLVIEIDSHGVTVQKIRQVGAALAVSSHSPRAG